MKELVASMVSTLKSTDMKKKDNPLYQAPGFYSVSGKCAIIAIAHYFKWDFDATERAFKLAGYNIRKGDGANAIQCKKVIETGALLSGKRVLYTSNRNGLAVKTFLNKHKRGEFILNQDGHVSLVKKGTVIDHWDTDNFKLIGWWQVYPSKKQYERALARRIMANLPKPTPITAFKFSSIPLNHNADLIEHGRLMHETILGPI